MEEAEKNKFMRIALKEAEKAVAEDEVPVGAVIVKDGKVIAKAYNRKEKKNCSNYHAEIVAIEKACKKIGIGDSTSAIFSSRWSLALCAPAR